MLMRAVRRSPRPRGIGLHYEDAGGVSCGQGIRAEPVDGNAIARGAMNNEPKDNTMNTSDPTVTVEEADRRAARKEFAAFCGEVIGVSHPRNRRERRKVDHAIRAAHRKALREAKAPQ